MHTKIVRQLAPAFLVVVGLSVLINCGLAQKSSAPFTPTIPKTWDDEAIATLEVPLANPVGSPKHVSAAAQQDQRTALVNANVVDVRDGRVTPNATIVLRDGRIASIGAGPAPAGVRVLDLKGKYVLPGLIDAHTHADNFAAFRRALESGVTTLRSAGVSNYADVGFHQLVKSGAVIGPDVVTAGYQVRPQIAEAAFLGDPQYADLMSGLNTIEKLRRGCR